MVRRSAIVASLLFAACLQQKVAPVAPKVDRARTIVVAERLDVAGLLAHELTDRGYAARPIVSSEADRAPLRRRLDALGAVLRALPAGRSSGAGLGTSPIAIARELQVDVIVHTRPIPRSSLLEVAIIDGKTGALVWRQARDGAEEPEAALAALAAMLPATKRGQSTFSRYVRVGPGEKVL